MTKEGILTGFMLSDARKLVDCPKCEAKAGWNCQRPSGRKAWPPHRERVISFREKLSKDEF